MVVNATQAPVLAPPHVDLLGWLGNTFMPWISYTVFNQVIPRVFEILTAPFIHREMLWAVVPLIATLLLMTLYFGAHKSEELGWNTAFGNSMVLIFTSINLLQFLYGEIDLNNLSFNIDTVVALGLMGEGIFLLFINFFHFLPKRLAYVLCSPVHINLAAAIGVIIVYSPDISLDIVTILAVVILYGTSLFTLSFIKFLVPSARHRLDEISKANYIGHKDLDR